MPEAFMQDVSVPVKWRLYGLINGYWINGLPVFASNNFFADKLKCTSRHISRALEELENDKLLTRNVQGYKRLILQGGMTPDVMGGGHGGSIKHDVGGHPNAISNAINITSEIGISREPIKEEEDKPQKTDRRVKDKETIYALFASKKQPWMMHSQQREAALRLFDRGVERIQRGLTVMSENEDNQFCPQASTPFEYEKKLPSLARFIRKNNL